MSEHSGITVDVPNALDDQTAQGQSQHSELKTSPRPPLSPLFIGDQRIQPILEKISQNEGEGKNTCCNLLDFSYRFSHQGRENFC